MAAVSTRTGSLRTRCPRLNFQAHAGVCHLGPGSAQRVCAFGGVASGGLASGWAFGLWSARGRGCRFSQRSTQEGKFLDLPARTRAVRLAGWPTHCSRGWWRVLCLEGKGPGSEHASRPTLVGCLSPYPTLLRCTLASTPFAAHLARVLLSFSP